MRVVDTSAWIEWLVDSSVGARIGSLLPSRETWLVPTIVQLELAKWLRREVEEEPADRVIALASKCRVMALDTSLAITAAEIASRFKLATADAIVYATAEVNGADILTCDAHFDGLPNVVFVDKSGA